MVDLNNKSVVLLSTAYLAPVQYYTKLIQCEHIYIEYYENYTKQTYRNRCSILSANGVLNLSIPVKKESKPKVITKDIRIDNSTRWRQIHMRALESAYRSSPFFLYYSDELFSLYQKDYTFLIDLNFDFLNKILEILDIQVEINETSDFKKVPFSYNDFSDSIHPKKKKPDNNFNPKNYYQVFENRFGFVPNLSIADLVFNMGPNSTEILIKSIKT